MDLSSKVPIVDGSVITRREFEKTYLRPQNPVILRGLWKQYPAYHKWTWEYMKAVMGDIEVDLFSTQMADPGKTITEPHAHMKFRDYMEVMESESTDLRMFLFQVFKHKPELLKDFGYPAITRLYIKIPFMFFGPKNAVTRMHQDIDMSNVFLTQFAGKRHVLLFAPDQSQFLYKLPFNVHSTVDIMNPDFDLYPALKYAKGYTADLEFGDTLFMPSGYWHHIEYPEAGFGLSVRSLGYNPGIVMKGLVNVAIRSKFDKYMFKIRGEKWFEYKKSYARQKAERAMRKVTA
jgi:hypothetical protein